MSKLTRLTAAQWGMLAASLEIDGRADIAARALFRNDELTYVHGQPYSEKAKDLAARQAWLESAIAARGVAAVINEMRAVAAWPNPSKEREMGADA